MGDKICEICAILSASDNLVLDENEFWLTILSYEQSYPGRALVCLKRHTGSLSDLTEPEILSVFGVIRLYEFGLKHTLQATLFNWWHLTNNAFQTQPYNPHVHFHVRPRYDHDVSLLGRTLRDTTFGHPIDRTKKLLVTPVEQTEIVRVIGPAFGRG